MQIETEELDELQTEETLAEQPSAEEIPPVDEPQTEELPTPKLPLLKRINYKSPKFWTAVLGSLVCLCVLVVILVSLSKPRQTPEPTVPTTEPTTPTEATEPTLPPPEASPFKPTEDFATIDGYLTCINEKYKSVLGIDVSEWQDDINWQKVKEAGVEFAMIRVGWRGSEQGVLKEDTCAQANYAGASAAGIKVGAYFFSQAITVAEAVEEANYLVDLIKDWNVEMPVVFDWEYIDETSRTAKVDQRTLTDCSKAFCDAVKAAGYEPMIYFNISHSYDRIYIRELTDYKFWLARYDTVLDYPYKVDMWQYTETGTVPGISTNVDINLYFPWKEE
jgi:GH25 family lysozyme M1 (1,4-beta-N-acetylmuramidase)